MLDKCGCGCGRDAAMPYAIATYGVWWRHECLMSLARDAERIGQLSPGERLILQGIFSTLGLHALARRCEPLSVPFEAENVHSRDQ